jgi:hypothetical protein
MRQAIDHRSDRSITLDRRRRLGSADLLRSAPDVICGPQKTLSLNRRFRRPSPSPPRTRA